MDLLKFPYVFGAFLDVGQKVVYLRMSQGAGLHVNHLFASPLEKAHLPVLYLELNPYPVAELLTRIYAVQQIDLSYLPYPFKGFKEYLLLRLHLGVVFYMLYLTSAAYPVVGAGGFPADV